jgi:hypothetical protein
MLLLALLQSQHTDYVMSCDTGIYNLSGNSQTIVSSRILSISTGTYIVSGNDQTLTLGHNLFIETGIYSVSGNPQTVSISLSLLNTTGIYTVLGNDQNFSNFIFSLTGGSSKKEWTQKLNQYVQQKPRLLTFSEMGKMGGRPRKYT